MHLISWILIDEIYKFLEVKAASTTKILQHGRHVVFGLQHFLVNENHPNIVGWCHCKHICNCNIVDTSADVVCKFKTIFFLIFLFILMDFFLYITKKLVSFWHLPPLSQINEIPKLTSGCTEFIESAEQILEKRKMNQTMLANHSTLLDLLEIPQLMDTYVKKINSLSS